MKTVSDFKKAGVVFVDGDTCQYQDEIPLNGVWYGHSNIGDDCYDLCNMKKFAWRENTGEKPSFNGLVEYETCDGIYNSGHTDCINFSVRIDRETVIKKWRPSLNQPEQDVPNNETAKPNDKPAFTQEFSVRGGHNAPITWIPCEIKYNGSKYIVIADANGREYSRRKSKVMIRDIDTRTPKQKAVDDACKSIDYIDNPIITSIVSDLYDKGFIKC